MYVCHNTPLAKTLPFQKLLTSSSFLLLKIKNKNITEKHHGFTADGKMLNTRTSFSTRTNGDSKGSVCLLCLAREIGCLTKSWMHIQR